MNKPLILASQSRARAGLLRQAGVVIETSASHIDEAALKRRMIVEGIAPANIATELANAKAQKCMQLHPERLILAADQILVFQGKIYDKPKSIAEAKAQLQTLRGHCHTLVSAAVIYEKSTRVWSDLARVELSMRAFSDSFLDDYLKAMGDDLFTTVGGYKIESLGSQLFFSIKGDYFSILGLPLLEVLEFLRGKGICQI